MHNLKIAVALLTLAFSFNTFAENESEQHQAYRNQLLKQAQQFGNIGDKAKRDAANRELDRMSGVSTQSAPDTNINCTSTTTGSTTTTNCR